MSALEEARGLLWRCIGFLPPGQGMRGEVIEWLKRNVGWPPPEAPPGVPECAACGQPAEGNCSIHRDGFGEGPQVDLCDACGGQKTPTCETLWGMIALRRLPEVASIERARQKREGGK